MRQQLPAGRYYIGDPCYVIDGERWQEFLDPYWETPHGGVFEFENEKVCAFSTQFGDGCYDASNGAKLGVDAGIIGAVPMTLVTCGDLDLGTEWVFNEPFHCSRDHDGRLHFGDFSVMTGDEWEDDDE